MKINSYIILSLLVMINISCDDDSNEIGQTINFNSDWQFKIDDQVNINQVDDESYSNEFLMQSQVEKCRDILI